MASRANSWKWLAGCWRGRARARGVHGRALASAPSATTGPTTTVGSTTATVTGSVDPGGQATTWYVEYGTSTSYGSKTTAKSAGSGSAAVDVSAALTGLQGRHDLPLPRRRDERRRHEPRHRRRLHDDGPARRDDRRRLEHHRLGGDAERDRRPEQPRHHVLLRVRHVDELRHEDADEERRLGGDRAVASRSASPACRPGAPTTSASSPRATPARAPARTRRSRRARRRRS